MHGLDVTGLDLEESTARDFGTRGAEPRSIASPRPGPRVNGQEGFRLRLYVGMLAADLGLLSLCFLAAAAVQSDGLVNSPLLRALPVILIAFAAIAVNSGAYSIEVLRDPRVGVKRVVNALLLSVVCFLGIAFSLKVSADFSRMTLGVGSLAGFAVLAGWRWSFGKWLGERVRWRFTNEVVLVDAVPFFPQGGEIVIFAEHIALSPSLDDPHVLDRAGKLLGGCDRVVLACPPERRTAWAKMLRGANIDVEVLAPELDRVGALRLGRFGDKSTILICCGPLGLRARLLKRTVDLAIAVPATLAALPLLLLVAAAVKLESRGPVFFKQPRVGLGNRIFNVLKFRSMRVDGSDARGARSTARNDDRVTRVGRFIRKTSLDELPQLINVLRGEMSLVGPRPHALHSTADDQLFWVIDNRYWDRHAVKPGMTGLAQVRGYRGATELRSDLTKRLHADLEYLNGWTIGRDLLIMFRTLRVLVHSRAY